MMYLYNTARHHAAVKPAACAGLVTECVPLECFLCATVYCQLVSFAVVIQIDMCEHWVFMITAKAPLFLKTMC